jgi:DNA replication protein DnaC
VKRWNDDVVARKLWTIARIPRIYWEFTSDDVTNIGEDCRDNITKWIESFVDEKGVFNRGLLGWYIYGSLGAGKTLLSCAMAKAVCTLHHEQIGPSEFEGSDELPEDFYFKRLGTPYVAFWIWADALSSMLVDVRKQERGLFFQDMKYADLMVLDNLGIEHAAESGWERTQLELVLRERVYAGKPTIITSNIDSGELEGRYGGAVASLVAAYFHEVEVSGDDYRTKNLVKAKYLYKPALSPDV